MDDSQNNGSNNNNNNNNVNNNNNNNNSSHQGDDTASITSGEGSDEGSVNSSPNNNGNSKAAARMRRGVEISQAKLTEVDAEIRQQRTTHRALKHENEFLRKQLYFGNEIHEHSVVPDAVKIYELKKQRNHLKARIAAVTGLGEKIDDQLNSVGLELEIEKSKPAPTASHVIIAKSKRKSETIERRVVDTLRRSSEVINQNIQIRNSIDALRKDLLHVKNKIKLAEQSLLNERVYWKEYQKQYDDAMNERNQILTEMKTLQSSQITEHKAFTIECAALDAQLAMVGLSAEPDEGLDGTQNRRRRFKIRDVKNIAKGAVQHERAGAIEGYEQWVKEIKSRTGYDDLDAFIDHFVTTEDNNYHRYLDLNGIIQEQMRLEQEIRQFRKDEAEMKAMLASKQVTTEQTNLYEQKLLSASALAEEQNRLANSSERILKKLEEVVSRVYETISGKKDQENKSNKGKNNNNNSTNASTEHNLFERLGIIESWLTHVLPIYKRKYAFINTGVSSISLLGTGSNNTINRATRGASNASAPQQAASLSASKTISIPANIKVKTQPDLVPSRAQSGRVKVFVKPAKDKKKTLYGSKAKQVVHTPDLIKNLATDVITLRPPSVTISESSSSEDETSPKPKSLLEPTVEIGSLRDNIHGQLSQMLVQTEAPFLAFKPEPTRPHRQKKKIRVYKGLMEMLSPRNGNMHMFDSTSSSVHSSHSNNPSINNMNNLNSNNSNNNNTAASNHNNNNNNHHRKPSSISIGNINNNNNPSIVINNNNGKIPNSNVLRSPRGFSSYMDLMEGLITLPSDAEIANRWAAKESDTSSLPPSPNVVFTRSHWDEFALEDSSSVGSESENVSASIKKTPRRAPSFSEQDMLMALHGGNNNNNMKLKEVEEDFSSTAAAVSASGLVMKRTGDKARARWGARPNFGSSGSLSGTLGSVKINSNNNNNSMVQPTPEPKKAKVLQNNNNKPSMQLRKSDWEMDTKSEWEGLLSFRLPPVNANNNNNLTGTGMMMMRQSSA